MTTTGDRRLTHFREEAAVLIGHRRDGVWLGHRRSPSRGTASRVHVDRDWVLARALRSRDVVGFFHTHPPDAGTRLSSTDATTMRAWCAALGVPLLCVIACGKDVGGVVFRDAFDVGTPLARIVMFPRGVMVAVEMEV